LIENGPILSEIASSRRLGVRGQGWPVQAAQTYVL